MISLAPTVAALLGIRAPAAGRGFPITEIIETIGKGQRLCLIILDSFGIASWNHHQALMPCFNALAREHQLTLKASSPPLTSVNFATMATGAPPAVHGVMSSRDTLKSETILQVMAHCSLRTAIVGREKASLRSFYTQPASFVGAFSGGSDAKVLDLARESMSIRRPDFLWFFFTDFDEASHRHGPCSAEASRVLARTDTLLGDLMNLLRRYHYAVLIGADHGQHDTADPDSLQKGIHDGKSVDDVIVPLVWKCSG
jgi:predicted AlkP superfamily pyrophosphatase or phosphodiesterase